MSITNLPSACSRAEALCGELGLEILEQKDIPYGRQFKVRAGSSTAMLNIYFGKKGLKLVVQGSGNEAKTQLDTLTARMEGRMPYAAYDAPTSAKVKSGNPDVVFAYEEPWIGTDESGKGDFFGS
jgi:ribonuclease HIII